MKLIATLFLLVTVLTFFSCSKRQDAMVAPIGTISITGIHEADSLKGTISAQIAIAGSTQANKIEVYLNDSLIATGNKAPYNLQWNTLGVTNGNYKLKAIAYDNTGKQTQIALDVIVKNILITLEIDPKVNGLYSNVMYIVSDSAGNILNSIKYNGTDKYIALAAAHAYLKDKFSIFEVKTDLTSQTFITSYLNIPRRSVWDLRGITINTNPSFAATNLSFTNIPAFSRITISTDEFGLTFTTPSSISTVTNYGLSPTGKQLVQYVDNNNNGHFGFFSIDTTKTSTIMNLADSVFNTSVKKTITISGATNVNFSIYGRSDKNYDSYYTLDNAYTQGTNLNYFYPDGNYLTDFKSNIYYNQNGWTYTNVYNSLIPQTITPFGTTASVNNKTLSGFNFTSQGSFDYYSVNFADASARIFIRVFSTSAYHSFQFPDILKLTNFPTVLLTDFKIVSFGMFKTPGFDASRLYYYTNEFPALSIPSQSATQYF
jgi:hypothetical protein